MKANRFERSVVVFLLVFCYFWLDLRFNERPSLWSSVIDLSNAHIYTRVRAVKCLRVGFFFSCCSVCEERLIIFRARAREELVFSTFISDLLIGEISSLSLHAKVTREGDSILLHEKERSISVAVRLERKKIKKSA